MNPEETGTTETAETTETEANALPGVQQSPAEDCPFEKEATFAVEGRQFVRGIRFAEGADFLSYDAGDLQMDALGRVLELSFTLKQVCHDRAVSVCIGIYETDAAGKAHCRGSRILRYPGFSAACGELLCRDVRISGVRFVLPEGTSTLAGSRSFSAKFTVHYAESDIP